MIRLNQQFKKGVLEILVLKIVNSHDVYGYDLIKQLDEQSSGYFILKEGSLYPIMYRLEDKGYIESYRSDLGEKRKVPRKYYKITSEGKEALELMIEEWLTFQKTVLSMIK